MMQLIMSRGSLQQLFLSLNGGLIQELFGLAIPVQPIRQTIESHAFGLFDSLGRVGDGLSLHLGCLMLLVLLLLLGSLLLDEQAGCEDDPSGRLHLEQRRCLIGILLHGRSA